MQTRNQVAAIVIGVLAVVASSFGDAPLGSQQPADVPTAPAAPAPPADADSQKKQKAKTIAARETVKARIARCRLHPETCRQ